MKCHCIIKSLHRFISVCDCFIEGLQYHHDPNIDKLCFFVDALKYVHAKNRLSISLSFVIASKLPRI